LFADGVVTDFSALAGGVDVLLDGGIGFFEIDDAMGGGIRAVDLDEGDAEESGECPCCKFPGGGAGAAEASAAEPSGKAAGEGDGVGGQAQRAEAVEDKGLNEGEPECSA